MFLGFLQKFFAQHRRAEKVEIPPYYRLVQASFLTGVGSLMNIFGASVQLPEVSDAEALAGDGRMVQSDFHAAYRQLCAESPLIVPRVMRKKGKKRGKR